MKKCSKVKPSLSGKHTYTIKEQCLTMNGNDLLHGGKRSSLYLSIMLMFIQGSEALLYCQFNLLSVCTLWPCQLNLPGNCTQSPPFWLVFNLDQICAQRYNIPESHNSFSHYITILSIPNQSLIALPKAPMCVRCQPQCSPDPHNYHSCEPCC